MQTASTINCDVVSRGITAEQRMEATESKVFEEELAKDTIMAWDDLSEFRKKLPLAVEVSSDNISIYKITNMHVMYSLIINNDFCISIQRGFESPIRTFIDYNKNKRQLYSQIKEILDHLDNLNQ